MGAEPIRHHSTSKSPYKPFGEGTSGVKKAPQARFTRRVFIGTIPLNIPVAKVMMISYSEQVIAPKISKAKFVKHSAPSTPTIVPRSLQVRKVTPPPVLAKCRRILPSRSQSKSDLTSKGVGSQVYSGSTTRSRAKRLTYAEVTLQSSATILSQGKNQSKE